jgi:hypothetical protein
MQTPLRAAAEVADAAGTATASGPAKAPSSNDLLVVGPGVLGSYLGKLWLEQYPDAAVVGQTNSDANHDRCLSQHLPLPHLSVAGVLAQPCQAPLDQAAHCRWCHTQVTALCKQGDS